MCVCACVCVCMCACACARACVCACVYVSHLPRQTYNLQAAVSTSCTLQGTRTSVSPPAYVGVTYLFIHAYNMQAAVSMRGTLQGTRTSVCSRALHLGDGGRGRPTASIKGIARTAVAVVAGERCVAVCCSVLQCVAVCCSVLQCVAVCCIGAQWQVSQELFALLLLLLRLSGVLQVCCSVLQCVAVCCSVMQCVVWANNGNCHGGCSYYCCCYCGCVASVLRVCCKCVASVLQRVAVCCVGAQLQLSRGLPALLLLLLRVSGMLQVLCSALQCVVVCCSVL